MNEYTGIKCPHCGYETGIEPALVNPNDPMLYCPHCDEPLFAEDEKLSTIPPEHALTCPTCGKIIDKRDLGQVLSHGVYNEATGKYECMEPVDAPYDTSKKVGDSVEWSKDKKRIDLN